MAPWSKHVSCLSLEVLRPQPPGHHPPARLGQAGPAFSWGHSLPSQSPPEHNATIHVSRDSNPSLPLRVCLPRLPGACLPVLFPTVSVSSGCCDRHPGWALRARNFFPHSPEGWKPKGRVFWGLVSPEASRLGPHVGVPVCVCLHRLSC